MPQYFMVKVDREGDDSGNTKRRTIFRDEGLVGIGWSAFDLREGPATVEAAIQAYEGTKPTNIQNMKRRYIEHFLSISEGDRLVIPMGRSFHIGVARSEWAHRMIEPYVGLDIANTLKVDWCMLPKGPKPFSKREVSAGLQGIMGDRGKTVWPLDAFADEIERRL